MPGSAGPRVTFFGRAQRVGQAIMTFVVPKSKASIKQNRFEFQIDGTKYDVPLLKYLAGDKIEQIAAAESKGGIAAVAAAYGLFGERGTPAGDAVRHLDQEQLEALTSAYMDASGVSVGESSASTDSSESTERPSDTT